MDKTQENEVKLFMSRALADGEKLSDLQNRVNEKFGLDLTYMEIRILASALDVDWKSRDPKTAKKETSGEAGETAAPEAAPYDLDEKDAAAPEGAPRGKTVVEVSKIVQPGTLFSGTVKFANGATADWYVDQTGRLGIENLAGAQPGREDIEDFQRELQAKLR
ncbi:MAG: hypothetical protein MJ016_03835 [Victivallaceae bacterium]|nr:hypothetical protein [Victivallaceae bacterium]